MVSKITFIFILLLTALASPASAETYHGHLDLFCFGKHHVYEQLPEFADFPTEGPPQHIAKDIDWESFTGTHKYKTRLLYGLSEGPDFNGHYKVVTYGCGTGCQGNWVINVTNGKAAGTFETSYGVSYNKDSGLLIANPPDQGCEYPPIDAVTYFTVKNDRLVTVKKIDISGIWAKQ